MINEQSQFNKGLITLLSLCLLFTSLSCEPLKKKFVRQKEKDQTKSEFVPVLDPVDYDGPVVLPSERYAYHYSLWRVWERDLQQIMDKSKADARKRYLLAQMIGELQEMRKWLVEEKQLELDELIADLNDIGEDLEEPEAMQSKFRIKKKLRFNAKDVRAGFKPELVQDYLIVLNNG